MISYSSKGKKYHTDGDYLIGNVDPATRAQIELILQEGKVESLRNVLAGFTLDDFQTMIPAVAYMAKRFLIGADTGLGKSIMMALYLQIHKAKGTLNNKSKAIVATTTSSLEQIKDVIESTTGMAVKHIPGDEKALMKMLSDKDILDYDIYIVTHSVFAKSIEFNRFMTYFKNEINIFVLDESMAVASETSITHNSIKAWVKNCEYRLFANATVIERDLEQIVNQFDLLDSELMPPLETLKKKHERFEVRKGTRGQKSKKEFVGYVGLNNLLTSLRYHYINVSRFEMGLTFDYEDILVPLTATPLQKRIETPYNYNYALFSPSTQLDTSVIPFDSYNVPALHKTITIVREEYEKRGKGIVIYAEPTACKEVLLREITSAIPGIQVGIIDGQSEGRDYIRQGFNNGEIHVLIINIPEALDLVGGEVMIMYTIPSKHYQARARIARGLNADGSKKVYYYLVYLHSAQSNYVKTTMVQNEQSLDDALNRGIVTARTLAKQIKQMEQNMV